MSERRCSVAEGHRRGPLIRPNQNEEFARTGRSKGAREFAQSLLQDLKDNQTDSAYEDTSANYRKKMSLEKFKALVKQREKVIAQQLQLQPDPNANPFGPNTIYRFTEMILIHGEGSYNLVIAVIMEGNQWKVDQFSISASTANKNSP